MKNEESEKVAFDVPEAVRRSGLSRAFLYKHIMSGRLRTVKVGRRRLVRADDLNAFSKRMSTT